MWTSRGAQCTHSTRMRTRCDLFSSDEDHAACMFKLLWVRPMHTEHPSQALAVHMTVVHGMRATMYACPWHWSSLQCVGAPGDGAAAAVCAAVCAAVSWLQIVRHEEFWNVSPVAAILMLLKPGPPVPDH
jgi:hypothetical protein